MKLIANINNLKRIRNEAILSPDLRETGGGLRRGLTGRLEELTGRLEELTVPGGLAVDCRYAISKRGRNLESTGWASPKALCLPVPFPRAAPPPEDRAM